MTAGANGNGREMLSDGDWYTIAGLLTLNVIDSEHERYGELMHHVNDPMSAAKLVLALIGLQRALAEYGHVDHRSWLLSALSGIERR